MLQNPYITNEKQCLFPLETICPYMDYPLLFLQEIVILPPMIIQKSQTRVNKGDSHYAEDAEVCKTLFENMVRIFRELASIFLHMQRLRYIIKAHIPKKTFLDPKYTDHSCGKHYSCSKHHSVQMTRNYQNTIETGQYRIT